MVCAATVGASRCLRGGAGNRAGAGRSIRPSPCASSWVSPPAARRDITARMIGPKLSDIWKQPIIIENRSGAGGAMATTAVAKATPDGHTLRADLRLVRDHRGPQQGSPVRPGEGFRGRDPDRNVQRRARGDAVAGRQDRQGPDRAGEGAARQARIRLGWRRQRHTHDRRALQDGRRHQYRARGLQGPAGDADRASFRPHPLRLPRPRHVAAFHQGREARRHWRSSPRIARRCFPISRP